MIKKLYPSEIKRKQNRIDKLKTGVKKLSESHHFSKKIELYRNQIEDLQDDIDGIPRSPFRLRKENVLYMEDLVSAKRKQSDYGKVDAIDNITPLLKDEQQAPTQDDEALLIKDVTDVFKSRIGMMMELQNRKRYIPQTVYKWSNVEYKSNLDNCTDKQITILAQNQVLAHLHNDKQLAKQLNKRYSKIIYTDENTKRLNGRETFSKFMDSRFIYGYDEHVVESPMYHDCVPVKDLWEMYNEFCKDRGYGPSQIASYEYMTEFLIANGCYINKFDFEANAEYCIAVNTPKKEITRETKMFHCITIKNKNYFKERNSKA